MSSLYRCIYSRWTSLRIFGLVISSNQKIKTMPVALYSLHSQSGIHRFLVQTHLQLRNCNFSSSIDHSPSNKDGNTVQFMENRRMVNSKHNHDLTELSTLDDDLQPIVPEFDDALPLALFEEISEETAVNIEASTPLPPTSFTLCDYVDKSETLTKLVLLGVDLSKLQGRPNVANMLLRLDFGRDVKDRLLFLKDVGVDEDFLGAFLTTNPFILSEDMENLQKRIQYLQSKKFNKEAISRMVSGAPYLLNFSVERLDNRLAFYQKELGLSTQKTRNLVTRLPKLLTGSLESVKEKLKVCRIELGFRDNEIQHMVTCVPKLLLASIEHKISSNKRKTSVS
ncbi:transcription termination factor 3, mitochondrial isoform X2 [Narcine bancroftii]|uniref:transcription termination factor 3, mitochondrial isoform X2 n=1 Tax=Narcine bancroftii TaxID=1343680 RepID=UPI003831410A